MQNAVILSSIDPNDGKSEDLKLVSRWARKALFPIVQFIFEPEVHCAIPDGYVYEMFTADMTDRLVGVKLLQGRPEVEKVKYMENLWKGIMLKRTNLVTDGLNARRSAIYSAMQNRFTGKYFQLRVSCCADSDLSSFVR